MRRLMIRLSRLGKELGVDPNAILATSHGRRSIDVLKLYDEKKANWECKQAQSTDETGKLILETC
jgi:hypothetical protein